MTLTPKCLLAQMVRNVAAGPLVSDFDHAMLGPMGLTSDVGGNRPTTFGLAVAAELREGRNVLMPAVAAKPI